MRTRILEFIGLAVVTICITTCGSLGMNPSVVAVSRNDDGTISVTSAAPWWGPGILSGVAAVSSAVLAVYLNNRAPPKRFTHDDK